MFIDLIFIKNFKFKFLYYYYCLYLLYFNNFYEKFIVK
jgi:hypothetical protein